jgi:capsular polysaccharide biosynthesis protein
MSESSQVSISASSGLVEIVRSVRRDLVAVVLVALIAAGGGAIVGKLTNKTYSSAQLVLSPLPLAGKGKVKTVEGKTSEDELESMLATPLDVKSTSLLCMSDEVLEKTLDAVNEGGRLSKPVKDLLRLKKTLSFQVAVLKETPYDITYTPLIMLTAEAKSPADAKTLVNSWARVVVEAAKRFQDAVQMPSATALEGRKGELKAELTQAELDSEKFWTENNILYLETRLNGISAQINKFRKERNTLEAEIMLGKGTAEALEKEMGHVPEKVSLNWKPSAALASILGAKLGLGGAKEGASKESEEAPMTVEVLNKSHWKIAEKLATKRSEVVGKEKKIEEIDRLVDALEKERLEVQADFAKATTGKVRVGREMIRLEEEFKDVATKCDFAHVASSLNHPVLQVISEGAEWPLPRFRRAILFGILSGALGFLVAACVSVTWRMFLKPALGG